MEKPTIYDILNSRHQIYIELAKSPRVLTKEELISSINKLIEKEEKQKVKQLKKRK